ncbi:MAG: multidrug transporter [Chloroflexota bacterium]|jgi:carbonic anhydrase/acetyltransferase-like protein (isoleucine patch superfamily)
MRRVILQETTHIHPFNEAACDLRVQNVPLWLWQRDILNPFVTEEREYADWGEAMDGEANYQAELLVHRNNLFFSPSFIEEFLGRSRAAGRPMRAALRCDDPAVKQHILPLTRTLKRQDNLLLADLWYLPHGVSQKEEAETLIVDTEPREVGYYHVPPYMATELGDLLYQLPRKALVAIDSWLHLFVVNILFGVFARGRDLEEKVEADWLYRLRVLFRAMVEQTQVLDCSEIVKIGNNVTIDPSAVIHGPTTIGNNVTIGPGAVIDNCLIGDNVNISQGCNLMLSVVSDGCFLPFNAALFMTVLMENSMVAQNTCLQLCVIGRDTFVGAGTTFTDFKVLPGSLRASFAPGKLLDSEMFVLGGCVGHHCRLSSGLVIYPARTVESDVVLLGDSDRHYITHDVTYEESDYHQLASAYDYPRLYPRHDE